MLTGTPKKHPVEFITIHANFQSSGNIATEQLLLENGSKENCHSNDDDSYSTFDLISYDERSIPQVSMIGASNINYAKMYNLSSPMSNFAPPPSLSNSVYSDGSFISDMTSGSFIKSVQSSESPFRTLYSNHTIFSSPDNIAANICLQMSNKKSNLSCKSSEDTIETSIYSESHQKLQEIKSRMKTIDVEVSSKKSMEIRVKLRSIERRHYRTNRTALKKSRVQSTNTLASYDSNGSPFYSSLCVYIWNPNSMVISTMTSMTEMMAQIVFFICLHAILYMCFNMIYWISTFYVHSFSIAMHSSILLFSN